MSHLLRAQAPITASGWELLDREARTRVAPALAARRLVDFSGPHGWEHAATGLGRTTVLSSPGGDGLLAAQRQVLPLVELRATFTVSREELLDHERGAVDLDLGHLDEAARRMALAENAVVFHGWAAAGITGIAESSVHPPIALGNDYRSYPGRVGRAVEVLRRAGIAGPYGLALGPEGYTGVVESTEHGGYLVFDHLRRILEGPIVWAPGVRGAVVLSLRGGDFLFESGEDLSLGYDRHDQAAVYLYLEESFSFRVASPDAAVTMTP